VLGSHDGAETRPVTACVRGAPRRWASAASDGDGSRWGRSNASRAPVIRVERCVASLSANLLAGARGARRCFGRPVNRTSDAFTSAAQCDYCRPAGSSSLARSPRFWRRIDGGRARRDTSGQLRSARDVGSLILLPELVLTVFVSTVFAPRCSLTVVPRAVSSEGVASRNNASRSVRWVGRREAHVGLAHSSSGLKARRAQRRSSKCFGAEE
jgi:hypothetical protein